MLTLELKFPGGRYHATPWGRHVNEGIPEWPPSPYRLVRALYDAWKRKRLEWPEATVEHLLRSLSSQPPVFSLPRATASHTRSFLSTNQKDDTDRALVFDAFVVVGHDAPLLVGWPRAELTASESARLDELLSLLNYLGRSESWVEASVLKSSGNVEWNCVPTEGLLPDDGHEVVTAACPVPAEEYQPPNLPGRHSRRSARVAPAGRWLDALAWTTADLFESKLSEPPALRFVPYLRSSRCFDVRPRPARQPTGPTVHGVLFSLESKVRPPVTTTLEVAERVRRTLMGIHRRIVADPGRVSPRFSGKEVDGRPLEGHRHLYVLPLDWDEDGWLDHLLAVCRQPLNREELLALDRLERVWQPDGRPDIRFVPIRWGMREELCPPSRRVRSATPFVAPRYHRRGRGSLSDWLVAEIRREAVNHGLVDARASEDIKAVPVERLHRRGRAIRWIEFRRNRKNDPVRLGYGFELEFPQAVAGPIALGYAAHFGMGLFLPVEQ